jgi:predicted secreted protein
MEESVEARTVAAGSEFDVELEAKPTAGFQWQAELDGPAGEVLEPVSQDWDAGPAIGGSATQRFRFRAKSAGSAKVTFKYGRSGDPEPRRRHAVEVSVH